jgi:HD-like signal output (HDOD) protein
VTRRRVLFADDEPAVLGGLRDMLYRQRKSWDMVFAPGGEAAVAELDRGPIDVLVTDMKMPGIDGPALLQIVKDRCPAAARIVLSGQAEREAAVRVVPLAHQFLSKPCEGSVLIGVIERTCALQARLDNDAVRTVIGRLDALPSAPHSYWALVAALRNPDVGLAPITEIIEADPAMAAKVLQVVNSAYFGLRRSVGSIMDAVRYLGVDVLTGLLLSTKVFSAFEHAGTAHFSVERLQARALHVARIARLLAAPNQRDNAYAAGLLLDVGQLILASAMPENFDGAMSRAAESGVPLCDAEMERFGTSHAEIGAYLLGVWGLPFPIVEAVALHHRPALELAGDRELLAVVHAVDALLHPMDGYALAASPALDLAFLNGGGWAEKLPGWVEKVAKEAPAPPARPAEMGAAR